MKIIAEFCQNHNGDEVILNEMISMASDGGATHAKIQTIFANDLSFRAQFEEGEVDSFGRIKTIKRPYENEYERLKKLELEYFQQEKFIQNCKSNNLIPLTTAFNILSIPHIKDLGWEIVKVASYDCSSLPLIEQLAKFFDELIISTGATFDDEISKTALYLNKIKKKYSLLHCVTQYPTPLEEMHLNRMEFLRSFTSSVGLSEHSRVSEHGVKACLAAIYLGAEIIERHFTVLPESDTRDGPVSISMKHLREIKKFLTLSKTDQWEYINTNIIEFNKMLGKKKRSLSHDELLNRDYYRGRFCNKINGQQIFNWQESAKNII